MNTTIEVSTGKKGQATTPVNPVLISLRALRKVQVKAAALAQEYEDSCDARNPDMEPEVPKFQKQQSRGSTQLKIQEMPCLLGATEKAKGNNGGVFRNLELFAEQLERYALSQGINRDSEHHKCMPSLLAEAQSIKVSWETVKLWLSEYMNTLKDRVANITAMMRLVVLRDENIAAFAERWLEVFSKMDLDKMSKDEILFVATCNNFSQDSNPENIMGKSLREMILWFHCLDLLMSTKRRADSENVERSPKLEKLSSRANGIGASKWADYAKKNSLSKPCCGVWGCSDIKDIVDKIEQDKDNTLKMFVVFYFLLKLEEEFHKLSLQPLFIHVIVVYSLY
ncbi:hypothetical protein BD560DRAFT_429546 [Blakeslea trispora]|nr:hypothetical protein BD560DRAFT_429546 [Blakeslea trispora]